MTTKRFEALLFAAIEQTDEMRERKIRRIKTYEEAGVLTTDPGLVVTMDDGAEFQVTIVQSREGITRSEVKDSPAIPDDAVDAGRDPIRIRGLRATHRARIN